MNISFERELKRLLSNYIKGEISVHRVESVLIVDIVTLGNHIWRYTYNGILPYLPGRDVVKTIVNIVVSEYREAIIKEFFK